MATFVLVHGAWHGGWCWAKVAPMLEQAGHQVYAPTLTGLGDRAHLLSKDVTLNTHIRDIVALLEYEDLMNVVLVGHSYAGMVIRGATEFAHRRIKKLVYLDAVLPMAGESVLGSNGAESPHRIEANLHGEGWRIPKPKADASGAVLGVTDKQDLDWMVERLTDHPLATFEQPIKLWSSEAAALPGAYILCTGRRNEWFEGMAQRARAMGYQYFEIPTGHDAMISAPRDLVAILLEIVIGRRSD
ncbi:MAG: alpha/beta fold hydrolase [Chloroflexi bacterium]|nr:alpha/beta fold hydrolase [Chloroflexota bacterium]